MIQLVKRLLALWPPFAAARIAGPYEVALGQAYCPGPAAGQARASAPEAGQAFAAGATKGQVTA